LLEFFKGCLKKKLWHAICSFMFSRSKGEIMKVAIAVWKDRISPVFDVSRKILILDIENNSVAEETYEMFENDNPSYKVTKLLGLNIETLICGAISNPLSKMITLHGIQTISFTCGNITDVIHAFLKDALPDQELSMPGCCGYRNRIRGKNQNKKMKEVKIMPKGDGTGPTGQGPTAGRGRGRCGAKNQQTNTPKGSGGGRNQGGQGKSGNQRKNK
jgi:predicted Fe-Mo cluster-binding NifX family protein